MKTSLRIKLSLMMFLEFAIWGAWMPTLYRYLITDVGEHGLGFSHDQASWIFAALWLACMVAPFIGGQIVDRWIPTQWFLAAVHFLGGLVLLTMTAHKTFDKMMPAMVIYALLYAPTLALTASLCFHHLTNADKQFGSIRAFGTIGWIAAGWGLTLWRVLAAKQGVIVPGDMLHLAGWCSLAMALTCCFLPHTPPKKQAEKPWAFVEAFRLLRNRQFALFLIISFVVTTGLQFYYLPTGTFLTTKTGVGFQPKYEALLLTVSQVAEGIVMLTLLALALKKLGVRKTLAIGVIAWPLRYVVFAMYQTVPVWLVVGSLALHGVGYTFFFVVSQIYVDRVAPKDIRASAQALLTLMTLGLGSFLGAKFTGWIMGMLTKDGVPNWTWIFLIPCSITVACALAFLLFFKEPPPAAAVAGAPADTGEPEPYEGIPDEEPPAPEGI